MKGVEEFGKSQYGTGSDYLGYFSIDLMIDDYRRGLGFGQKRHEFLFGDKRHMAFTGILDPKDIVDLYRPIALKNPANQSRDFFQFHDSSLPSVTLASVSPDQMLTCDQPRAGTNINVLWFFG